MGISSDKIKQWAWEVGFDLVGVAPAAEIAHAEALTSYLAKGYQGEMDYLARGVAQRVDPRVLVAGARSVICVGLSYYVRERGEEPAGETEAAGHRKGGEGGESDKGDMRYGRVARYAWGRDYHVVMKERLERLAERIRSRGDGEARLRCCVDSAPVAEKSLAARAGLGWIGKNGLLLNERFGSWLVLGEIVTDLELEAGEPAADRCGDCRRCLEACPTGALVAERVLEARRCISYLTIESGREIPAALGKKLGDRLFGCDICQEVCPYNQRAVASPAGAFAARADWRRIKLAELLTMSEEAFARRYEGSCMVRAGLSHMQEVARAMRDSGGA